MKGVFAALSLSQALHANITNGHIFQIPSSLSISVTSCHFATPWLLLKQRPCLTDKGLISNGAYTDQTEKS